MKRRHLPRCDDKARYPSEAMALEAAVRAAVRSGQPLRVYCCPQCAGWHLTHTARLEAPRG